MYTCNSSIFAGEWLFDIKHAKVIAYSRDNDLDQIVLKFPELYMYENTLIIIVVVYR